jgi:hypothetical protein
VGQSWISPLPLGSREQLGVRDGDEHDARSDPADPTSTP